MVTIDLYKLKYEQGWECNSPSCCQPCQQLWPSVTPCGLSSTASASLKESLIQNVDHRVDIWDYFFHDQRKNCFLHSQYFWYQMCGVFPYIQQFWPRIRTDPKDKRLSPTRLPLFRQPSEVVGLPGYPHFRLGYKLGVSMTPLFMFHSLLTELREALYLLLLVYYKGSKLGTVKQKRSKEQSMGKGHRASMSSVGTSPAQHLKKRKKKVLVTQSCLTLCDPWTGAHQVPLFMGFSRQEYWSGLPFPSPGDFSDPGIEPRSPALQADALPSKPPGKSICKVLVK